MSHTHLTINNSCREWLVEVHQIFNFHFKLLYQGISLKSPSIFKLRDINRDIRINNSACTCNYNLALFCMRASEYSVVWLYISVCYVIPPRLLILLNALTYRMAYLITFYHWTFVSCSWYKHKSTCSWLKSFFA